MKKSSQNDQVDTLERFDFGGPPQWALIRGHSRTSPVLLWIQQGPGVSLIHEAADQQRQLHLEEQFRVVYWDQRGTGKSFGAKDREPISFSQATADLRQYAALPWSERQVLAFQVYSQISTAGVPFQAMPTLAGDGRMRGFFAGRFRDRDVALAQLEYRVEIWGRLGLAVFGGLGNVAARLSDLDLRHPKASGGGGVRVLLDRAQGINVRLDVGTTNTGDTNVYLALGEAF